MKIHHIGYAVHSIEKAREAFIKLGYREESEVIYDEVRNINVLFMVNCTYRIELVECADRGLKSPVDAYLKRSGGDAPYHICYETSDLDAEVKELLSEKYRVVDMAKEAVGVNGRRVVFLYKYVVGLIELVENVGDR